MRKRVLGERDSGFKNVDEALQWNQALKARSVLPHEYKIDNSHNDPEKTAQEVLKLI